MIGRSVVDKDVLMLRLESCRGPQYFETATKTLDAASKTAPYPTYLNRWHNSHMEVYGKTWFGLLCEAMGQHLR